MNDDRANTTRSQTLCTCIATAMAGDVPYNVAALNPHMSSALPYGLPYGLSQLCTASETDGRVVHRRRRQVNIRLVSSSRSATLHSNLRQRERHLFSYGSCDCGMVAQVQCPRQP